MSLYTQRNSLPLWYFTFKKYELVEDWYEYFRDDFDDGVLGYEWTTHGLGPDRTINEAAGVETIAITNNVDARWWFSFPNNAPKMYVPLGVLGPCRITTKINSIDGDPPGTITNCIMAGIFIATYPEGASGTERYVYKWGRYKYDAGPYDGIRVQANNASWAQQDGGLSVPYCPLWLRLNITVTGSIYFQYSFNGTDWFDYSHLIVSGWNIGASFVGIFAHNRAGTSCTPYGNTSAEFEYFLIEVYEAQSPTEEECYAPIDTRAPTVFYDGRVKSMSTLKRAIDDKTGMFQISDLSMVLANEDKHFSSLMSNRILKNQEVVMYHAWTDEPEANKSHVITMICEDHSIKGTDFLIKLKDISQKYFTKKIPEDICTEDDYEHINPDHEGRPKPEVLGQANLPTGYEHEGAVEAVYVDTTTGRYIAANRPLHDITQVFLDDVLQADPGQYTWFVADGDTYIDFVAAPGTDEIVSFNAEGYMRAAWDSDNNYIQNPAYMILFYLRFIMGIPASLIDFPAFATLAAYYTAIGEDESFYLVIQEREDAMEILRGMLFTAGAKGWINTDGEFTIARKDIDDWEIASTDYHIFEQTDLIGPPHRKWNLTGAINTVNVEFGYIPWQNLYTGARSEYRDNRYEERMEDDIRRRIWEV